MSSDSKSRVRLAVVAAVAFAGLFSLALWLLFTSKFSGTEFTAFVLAFAVLAVVVGFAPEIQEVSIAGNVVKLKEVKAEAVRAIESLNKSRVEMLRVFLSLTLKHSGGFGSSDLIDPRAYAFWNLLKLIREYQCLKELKEELLINARVLAGAQLRNISRRDIDPRIITSENIPDPIDLAAVAFAPEGIEEAAGRTSPRPENYREEIKEALVEYSKFYALILEIESLSSAP
ncbi:hypothetical protein ACW9H6_01865 [Pseudomonas sp. SDO528_S397]